MLVHIYGLLFLWCLMSSFAEKQKELKEKSVQKAIFEATIKLIAEKGGDGLTMQDIAAAAGIATGTLYNYFKNKEELLYFIDRQLHAIILAEGQTIVASAKSAGEKLKELIVEILDFCKEYHSVFALAEQLGIKDRIPREEKDQNVEAGYHCFECILNEGVEKGEFFPMDTRAVAEMFFASAIGVSEIQKWLQEYQTEQQTQKLLDFFSCYLKGRQA